MLTFALFWLAVLVSKGTPAGRFMHRWMVEKPAALGSRIGAGGFLLFVLMAAGTALVWYVMERDGITMLGMAAPELMHMIAMFELTTWLEVAMTVVATASVARVGAVRVWIRALVSGKREARARPVRRERPAANDDEDRSWARAA